MVSCLSMAIIPPEDYCINSGGSYDYNERECVCDNNRTPSSGRCWSIKPTDACNELGGVALSESERNLDFINSASQGMICYPNKILLIIDKIQGTEKYDFLTDEAYEYANTGKKPIINYFFGFPLWVWAIAIIIVGYIIWERGDKRGFIKKRKNRKKKK